jgi:hypothetical protein
MSDDYDRSRRRETVTSGKAIASLICSLLICIPILPSILAIIFGALGLRDIGRSRGRLSGQGLAISGLVLGSVGLVLVGPAMLLLLLLPAVQKVREAAYRTQSANNLKQIGLAIHKYHDTYNSFPPAVVYSKDGQPLYSWRVLILPFLGEERLYRQFKLDEPWDSPNNRPLLAQMPRVYVHPSQGHPAEPFATYYQVFTTDVSRPEVPWEGHAMFDIGPKAGKITFPAIVDGTSNTIMVAEAADPVPWSQPTDMPYAPNQPLPKLGVSGATWNALMADASVIPVPQNTEEKTVRAMITRNGGEMVELPSQAPPPPVKKSTPRHLKDVQTKDVLMK